LKKINLSCRAILIISLAAAAFLYGININFAEVGSTNDDAHYVNAARWFAGTQTIQKSFSGFPLGYSLMLVPAAKLFPESLNIFKVFNIFLFLLIIYVLFGIFKDYLTKKELLFFLLLGSLNPLMVRQSSFIMSEGAFLLILLSAFYFIKKALKEYTLPYGTLLAAAFFSAYLCSIRFEGFLFASAVILGLMLTKKSRHALYFTFFYVVMVVIYMQIATVFTGSGGRYFEYFFNNVYSGGIFDIIGKTSIFYFVEFTYSIFLKDTFGVKLGRFAIIPAVIIFGIFSAGFLGKKKYEGEIILKIYFVLYAVVHLLFPSRAKRFLLPLTPFIIFYFLQGAAKFGRIKLNAVFACLLVFCLYAGIEMSYKRHVIQPRGTLDFIKTDTSPNAVFTSVYGDRIFLYTNRKAIAFTDVNDEDNLFFYLAKNSVDYVYVNLFYESMGYMYIRYSQSSQKKIVRCMENNDFYELVYKNEKEKTAIWRVNSVLKENYIKANDYALKAMEFAKEFYAKSLKVFPSCASSANNFALIYITEGKFDEAEKILIDGIKASPRSAALYALIGQLYKLKSEYKKSVENYKKAFKFASNYDDKRTKRTAEGELRALGAWAESREK